MSNNLRYIILIIIQVYPESNKKYIGDMSTFDRSRKRMLCLDFYPG